MVRASYPCQYYRINRRFSGNTDILTIKTKNMSSLASIHQLRGAIISAPQNTVRSSPLMQAVTAFINPLRADAFCAYVLTTCQWISRVATSIFAITTTQIIGRHPGNPLENRLTNTNPLQAWHSLHHHRIKLCRHSYRNDLLCPARREFRILAHENHERKRSSARSIPLLLLRIHKSMGYLSGQCQPAIFALHRQR